MSVTTVLQLEDHEVSELQRMRGRLQSVISVMFLVGVLSILVPALALIAKYRGIEAPPAEDVGFGLLFAGGYIVALVTLTAGSIAQWVRYESNSITMAVFATTLAIVAFTLTITIYAWLDDLAVWSEVGDNINEMYELTRNN